MDKEKAIHLAHEMMTDINEGDFTIKFKVVKIEILFNHIFKYIQFFTDTILMNTMEKKLIEFSSSKKFPRAKEYLDKLYTLSGKNTRKSIRLENKRKIGCDNNSTKRRRIQ